MIDLRCLTVFVLFNIICFANGNVKQQRVCVIGAGIAGLATIRYLKENANLNITVFESAPEFGGTWYYYDNIGLDEYGDPIHVKVYKSLRTNLPKPSMTIPGFPITKDVKSYQKHEEFYDYLTSYVQHFELEKYIKYLIKVTKVERIDNAWTVTYLDKNTKDVYNETFDYVVLAVGFNGIAKYPLPYPGEDKFKGPKIHSIDYRTPDKFDGKKILVVGFGPSAVDITMELERYNTKIYLSHHSDAKKMLTKFGDKVIRKPGIKEYKENGVVFTDGSEANVDVVIYCTGYRIFYPFLDESCGLTVKPKSIMPLYKQIVNINNPTMFLIGNVAMTTHVITVDVQARYVAAHLSGKFELPSNELMWKNLNERLKKLNDTNKTINQLHLLDRDESAYYDSITKEAGIEPVPSVVMNIRLKNMSHLMKNLYSYRNYNYTIVDDDNFICTYNG